MAYISRREVMENQYRKVEALYRKGNNATIIACATGLSRMEALDVMQKIFYLDLKKKTEWAK